MKNIFLLQLLLILINPLQASAQDDKPETLQSLAAQFACPGGKYHAYAWWHWLGANYSQEGITRDLEAMKASGIGGVVVFNAPSWVDPSYNPWQDQTYRSEKYWSALGHALREAERLDMKVGIHNTPGWSSTGGPWITPEYGMQTIWFSHTSVEGGKRVSITLPNPAAGMEGEAYYRDEAVLAVPELCDVDAGDLIDITDLLSKDDGKLIWNAPKGGWKIFRIGYFPTFARSHPTPDDVADKALESDKMNPIAARLHWKGVLTPLKERFKEYIGTTFDQIWIDSYEAGFQIWSPNFRKDFIRIKGYDPVRQLALAYSHGDSIIKLRNNSLRRPHGISQRSAVFVGDWEDVTNRLFLDCYSIGKEMINEAGFLLYWEPYPSIGGQPFDTSEGVAISDVPVSEFWVHSRSIDRGDELVEAAAKYGKRIYGAEAFTGMEATCRYTETPAMLKRPADMGYNYGINRYYLHSWAHNPFSDKYQPGWGFAHYGTHFSRNQTWFEPGKAFFTYLSRCQMLLQQGSFVSRNDSVLNRRTPEAEIFFIRNTGKEAQLKTFELPVSGRQPEIWDAYGGTISQYGGNLRDKDSTKILIDLELSKDGSLFVIFPANRTKYKKSPVYKTVSEKSTEVSGDWSVTFLPQTKEAPFSTRFPQLVDFSRQDDFAIKYFSGTAVYEKTLKIGKTDISSGRRVVLDLGTVYDMAAIEINGRDAGTLWFAPFKTDITEYLKPGNNHLKIKVTNTWVNRLIGDEQHEEDFEWTDRNQGLRAMRRLPDWFVKDEPRPSKDRKTFTPWYYFNKDSKLLPAGLLGPVKIVNLVAEQM
ncbi:MAG: hypothetical protein LBF79_02790 [Dysgonamonadaceae bacterium]|jgi:hypothetical protein|nr:hypothetical protein [Dysgonamonadaceae bacterium]